VEGGGAPCAAEWAIVALEENIRATDQLTVSMIIGEGINVEVNRELQESAILLAGMAIAILVLLWFSLRRLSDVAIVGATLVFSLLWMQGLIGWGIIAGSEFDLKIISRSQFSILLPILILALGIDDSLHALHRYKEERPPWRPSPPTSRRTYRPCARSAWKRRSA
jgi:predicted RND superfamily exporter protein